MKVKKYLAASLPEAMAKVRQELGRDAIILHTQKIRVGGMMGVFGRTMVEVTAATDDSVGPVAVHAPAVDEGSPPVAPAAPAMGAPLPIQGSSQALVLAPPNEFVPPPPRPVAQPPAGSVTTAGTSSVSLSELQAELDSVKTLMNQVIRRLEVPDMVAGYPEVLRQLYQGLTASGVEPELAADVISQAAAEHQGEDLSGESARQIVRELVARRLGPGRGVEVTKGARRVIALVGPTGVGKTTTLAKLAAHFALAQKRSVALVTADTYRIAAVEQLRTYGEIIGVPVEVIFTPQEVKSALARHEHRDVVFLDTAGRSHKNVMQMSELKGLLEAAKATEIHLVVSLTTNLREAREVLEHFLPTSYNRVLLTKLDESSSPGQVLNLAQYAKRPLSYVTTGQSVPDDMELAEPGRLSKLILGG